MLVLSAFTDAAISCHYSGSDYLNLTIGHGIQYQVHDTAGLFNGSIRSVSQPVQNSEFAFTLNESENESSAYGNSWLGGSYSSQSNAYIFDSGCPSDTLNNLYALFSILKDFDSGNQWTVHNTDYRVELIGECSVNNTPFPDCARVTVDSSDHDDESLKGSGYFMVARNVGIIKMAFNRNTGSTVVFEYQDHGQQDSHKLCGTLSSSPGWSGEGLVVQLSNCDGAVSSPVNANGHFIISVSGAETTLRVGYDDDRNGVFDQAQYPSYPKEFRVNCLSGEVTTSAADMTLQVMVGDDCETIDGDGDGVPDLNDNCPDISNTDQVNSDSDAPGDACDNCPGFSNADQDDADSDGIGNPCDNCWAVSNPDQADDDDNCPSPPYNADPVCGDACTFIDHDGDGVPDLNDNCPDQSNANQIDSDDDGIGDPCDNCWAVSNPDQADDDDNCPSPPYNADPVCGDACNDLTTCGNGVREGDEVCDGEDLGGETCLSQGYPAQGVISCLDDCSDFDVTACIADDLDGDGIPNASDNCPAVANPDQANSDSDSHGDVCDNCSLYGNDTQIDIDGDGIGNVCDNCLMVFNPDQLDSNRDCYPPPYYKSDPCCGDACESPGTLAMSALVSSSALEQEVVENIIDGDIEALQKLLSESNATSDFIVRAFVDAWEGGELTGASVAQIWKGWVSLRMAKNLNELAIKMLKRDQSWRRRSARALVELALHCKEYVIALLEK
jgi:hypothetical protein